LTGLQKDSASAVDEFLVILRAATAAWKIFEFDIAPVFGQRTLSQL
jgi:hypothetical protein